MGEEFIRQMATRTIVEGQRVANYIDNSALPVGAPITLYCNGCTHKRLAVMPELYNPIDAPWPYCLDCYNAGKGPEHLTIQRRTQ